MTQPTKLCAMYMASGVAGAEAPWSPRPAETERTATMLAVAASIVLVVLLASIDDTCEPPFVV